MKTLNKVALVSMTAQETKDVETSLAGMRTDKLKQEREAVKQKKGAGPRPVLVAMAPGVPSMMLAFRPCRHQLHNTPALRYQGTFKRVAPASDHSLANY